MVLVLVGVWATFGVWWFRTHAAASLGDSVGSFRRDLTVLERTAPATMRPANRLRVPTAPAGRPAAASRSAVTARTVAGRPVAGRPGATARRPGAEALRRRQAVKRRRDVLFVLVVAVVATMAMAAATRSHAVIGVQLLVDAALAAYVALLVRMRNVAAERDMKLTYLPSGRPAPRRRVVEPDVAYAGAYAGGSYAELSLRRAAN